MEETVLQEFPDTTMDLYAEAVSKQDFDIIYSRFNDGLYDEDYFLDDIALVNDVGGTKDVYILNLAKQKAWRLIKSGNLFCAFPDLIFESFPQIYLRGLTYSDLRVIKEWRIIEKEDNLQLVWTVEPADFFGANFNLERDDEPFGFEFDLETGDTNSYGCFTGNAYWECPAGMFPYPVTIFISILIDSDCKLLECPKLEIVRLSEKKPRFWISGEYSKEGISNIRKCEFFDSLWPK